MLKNQRGRIIEKVLTADRIRRGRALVVLPSGSYIIPSGEMRGLADSVDPERMLKLQADCARADAGNFLSISERTTGQLLDKLRSLGYPEEIAGETVQWASEKKYVDDRRFCELYMRSKTMGKIRLRLELLKKGAAEDSVEAALKTVSDEQDLALAVKLISRKYGRIENRQKARARAAGWLSRRGYSGEFIHRVLQEAL